MKYVGAIEGLVGIGIIIGLWWYVRNFKKELIQTIMATEQELDQQLTDLATATTDGAKSISDAVTAAADRVIKALEAKPNVDLTDEIASVSGIKDAVKNSTDDMVAKLAAIAPDKVEAPAPAGGAGETGTPTGTAPETGAGASPTGTGETPTTGTGEAPATGGGTNDESQPVAPGSGEGPAGGGFGG